MKQNEARAARAASACLCNPFRSRLDRGELRERAPTGNRKPKLGWAAAEADLPPDLASGSVATGLGNSPAAAPVALIDNTREQFRPLPVLAWVQDCAKSVRKARWH